MNKRVVKRNNKCLVLIESDTVLIDDEQDILDLMATVRYEDEANHIVLNKEALSEDFFDLKTGIAGGILQKLVVYSTKLAIVGDFSSYTSKALRDLIRESNRGKDVFFVGSEEEGIERLSAV